MYINPGNRRGLGLPRFLLVYGHPIEHRVHLLSFPLDLDFQIAGRLIQLYNVEVRGGQ